jgi:hypothetical protein
MNGRSADGDHLNIIFLLLVLIYVRGLSQPQGLVRLEGLGKLKRKFINLIGLLSRQCWILKISQPHRPPRTVTAISQPHRPPRTVTAISQPHRPPRTVTAISQPHRPPRTVTALLSHLNQFFFLREGERERYMQKEEIWRGGSDGDNYIL